MLWYLLTDTVIYSILLYWRMSILSFVTFRKLFTCFVFHRWNVQLHNDTVRNITSPIFETVPEAYHFYFITEFLSPETMPENIGLSYRNACRTFNNITF